MAKFVSTATTLLHAYIKLATKSPPTNPKHHTRSSNEQSGASTSPPAGSLLPPLQAASTPPMVISPLHAPCKLLPNPPNRPATPWTFSPAAMTLTTPWSEALPLFRVISSWTRIPRTYSRANGMDRITTMGQASTSKNWEKVIRAMGMPRGGMGRGPRNQVRGRARGLLRRSQGQGSLRWR